VCSLTLIKQTSAKPLLMPFVFCAAQTLFCHVFFFVQHFFASFFQPSLLLLLLLLLLVLCVCCGMSSLSVEERSDGQIWVRLLLANPPSVPSDAYAFKKPAPPQRGSASNKRSGGVLKGLRNNNNKKNEGGSSSSSCGGGGVGGGCGSLLGGLGSVGEALTEAVGASMRGGDGVAPWMIKSSPASSSSSSCSGAGSGGGSGRGGSGGGMPPPFARPPSNHQRQQRQQQNPSSPPPPASLSSSDWRLFTVRGYIHIFGFELLRSSIPPSLLVSIFSMH
jgi:hypothetical protein